MKVNEIVTNKIIEKLKAGCPPWQSPYAIQRMGTLQNFKTKHRYTGINLFLLWESPTGSFLSYKQAQELGFQVRKGAKSYMCVFFTKFTPKGAETKVNKKGEIIDNSLPCLRYYNLFDIADIEGLEAETEKLTGIVKDRETDTSLDLDYRKASQICDGYLNRNKIKLRNIDDRFAFYSITEDYINIPKLEFMKSKEDYYSTLFHEITHSTGHPTRLDRPLVGRNHHSVDKYSKEELVAEIGSAFLCAEADIIDRTIDNSAAYCEHWIKALKADHNLIISAASRANKAYDFVLNNLVNIPKDSEDEQLAA